MKSRNQSLLYPNPTIGQLAEKLCAERMAQHRMTVRPLWERDDFVQGFYYGLAMGQLAKEGK